MAIVAVAATATLVEKADGTPSHAHARTYDTRAHGEPNFAPRPSLIQTHKQLVHRARQRGLNIGKADHQYRPIRWARLQQEARIAYRYLHPQAVKRTKIANLVKRSANEPYGRTADGSRWLVNDSNYALFALVLPAHDVYCARKISARETGGTYEHRVSYGFRWNVVASRTDLAGGIGQAKPTTKMRIAGSDWATNPVTQIRWMKMYADGRYGSLCAGLAHHYAQGWW